MAESTGQANRIAKLIRGDVRVVYDVGACRGMWSKAYAHVFDRAEFHLFDVTQKRPCVLPDGPRVTWHEGVLSGPDVESVEFYAAGELSRGGGDTYYKETTGYQDDIEPVTMPARTLDSFGLPSPQVMKIDTQGSELDIMRGASNAMESVLMVQIELSVVEYNAGGARFDDCCRFLIAKGLHPVAVEELHYRENCLLQLDLIFARHPERLSR